MVKNMALGVQLCVYKSYERSKSLVAHWLGHKHVPYMKYYQKPVCNLRLGAFGPSNKRYLPLPRSQKEPVQREELPRKPRRVEKDVQRLCTMPFWTGWFGLTTLEVISASVLSTKSPGLALTLEGIRYRSFSMWIRTTPSNGGKRLKLFWRNQDPSDQRKLLESGNVTMKNTCGQTSWENVRNTCKLVH